MRSPGNMDSTIDKSPTGIGFKSRSRSFPARNWNSRADPCRNLDAILTRLTAAGLPVLLAGMLAPRNLGPDYAAAFDAIFPRLAERHGVALYPFFLDGVAMDPALNQPDGIHPNAAGVGVIVERITPSVIRLLEAARSGANAGG